jgi:hypothetical protein
VISKDFLRGNLRRGGSNWKSFEEILFVCPEPNSDSCFQFRCSMLPMLQAKTMIHTWQILTKDDVVVYIESKTGKLYVIVTELQ